jgi:hypothetical protein
MADDDVDPVPPDEPHLPDVQPVASQHRENERITDPRAMALLFLVFLLVLALMYELTQGRG